MGYFFILTNKIGLNQLNLTFMHSSQSLIKLLTKLKLSIQSFLQLSMSQKIKVKKLENSPYVIAPDEVIGKGSFSVIVRAYNLENPKENLVSKIISVKDTETSVTIKSQIQILKQLPHHPNLVNCMKFQISSQNNFYLIMEFCNEGNLDKYLVRKKFNIPQEKIWFFLKQFCEGYKVLYNSSIIHRDIKPQNILIHNGDFKLADFGLSRRVQNMEAITNMSSKGTPLYMAPELHLQKQGSSKVDVFSLGVVLYKMAFGGKYPFFDQDRKYRSINDYFKELMLQKLRFPENHKRSPALVSLIQKMLLKDKQKRIGWKEIFQMQQIKSAIRFQRKKELAPMDEFRRSLMIVNKSQTFVNIIEAPFSQAEGNQNDGSTSIILEQTFNKKNKSDFQKVLFKNKLLYTLIEYTNKKIEKFTKKASQILDTKDKMIGEAYKLSPLEKYGKLYKSVCRYLSKIVEEGILYSLYVISKLQQVSGDWTQFNEGEIMNFEDIFENDKGIFIEQYKTIKSSKVPKVQMIEEKNNAKTMKHEQPCQVHCISDKYQDILYRTLSEFFEYPTSVRSQLRSIYALLLNIYDLAIKSQAPEPEFNQNQMLQVSKNFVQKVQDQTTLEFYQYLMDIETIEQKTLQEQMTRKGLIFL